MVNPLSRITMQNIIKDKSPIISARVDGKGCNLDTKENNMILDIIKGEREVQEKNTKNTTITLDEAVNRIKNNR